METAEYVVTLLLAASAILIWRALRNLEIRRVSRWQAILQLVAGIVLLAPGVISIRAIQPIDMIWPEKPHRNSASANCDAMLTSAFTLVEPSSGEEVAGPASAYLTCPVQSVVNDGSTSLISKVDAETCWPVLAFSAESLALSREASRQRNCYKLAFLEFSRSGSFVHSQVAALNQTIDKWHESRPGQEVYTIYYVHGWRHGSAIGDRDVRRLRTLASYASSHLLERCRVTGRHCGALVLAIYVSWPGDIGLHDSPAAGLQGGIWAGLNALTFPSRKRLSDEIGFSIVRTIAPISKRLLLGNPQNKTLLLGHSLGGNALLTALKSSLMAGVVTAASLPEYERTTYRMNMPADLTVLLNPASEAEKWAQIRSIANSRFPGKLAADSDQRPRIWPLETPPRFMLVTNHCEYLRAQGSFENQCDTIVDSYFWASQVFAEFEFGLLQRKGAGHLSIAASKAEADLALNQLTHFLEINWAQAWPRDTHQFNRDCVDTEGSTPPTGYSNARCPINNRCLAEPSWLYCTRNRGKNSLVECEQSQGDFEKHWNPWDNGGGLKFEVTLGQFAAPESPAQSNIQFGTGRARGAVPANVQAADPIWGVEADKTAIGGHGQIISAPLICAYTKLLFDDVTRRPVGYWQTKLTGFKPNTLGRNTYREATRTDYLRLRPKPAQ